MKTETLRQAIDRAKKRSDREFMQIYKLDDGYRAVDEVTISCSGIDSQRLVGYINAEGEYESYLGEL